MAKKDFAKARAGIIASRRVYAQDRNADFAYTNDVMDSLFSNLGTNVSRFAGNLTGQHARSLQAIAGLAKRTEQGNNLATNRARNFIGGQYGSAISGAAAPLLRVADRGVQAGRQTMKGQTRAGATLATGGNTVMDILKGGVQEAQAAAQYQTAEALSYRAKEDAKLIADQMTALQQTRLQAKLEFETWKKQQEYLKKEEQTNTGLKGVSQVAESVTQWGVDMRKAAYELTHPEDGEPVDLTVDQLINAITAGDSLLLQDPNAMEALRATAKTVLASVDTNADSEFYGETQDFSRQDEADALKGVIHELYPNYKASKIKDLGILSQLNSLYGFYDNPPGAVSTDPNADPSATRVVGGNRYDSQGHAIPEAPATTSPQAKAAPTDGSAMGVTKSGRAYMYKGGNPYYQDTGYVVPANDRP